MNYFNSTFQIRDDAKRMKRTQMRRVPGTARAVPGTAQVRRICGHCDKVFTTWRGYPGKACSRDCADKLRRTKVDRVCLNCGVAFQVNPSQFTRYKGAGKYCSRKCASEGRVKETANKPPPDKWGRTRRAADKEWQKAVRERDNYTCQRCGKYEALIHTHHVAPRSRRPDLKHDVANGKCLCGSCHQWVHHHPKEATALGLLSDASYERAQKEKLKCSICGSKHFGLGFCGRHYRRFKKWGDPLLAGRQGHPEEPPHRVSAME